MNIKNPPSCDITPNRDLEFWTEMHVCSLLIVLKHELIYTWQIVPLEFNLSTPIFQMDFIPIFNSSVHK